jgi:hypothetical protein
MDENNIIEGEVAPHGVAAAAPSPRLPFETRGSDEGPPIGRALTWELDLLEGYRSDTGASPMGECPILNLKHNVRE